MEIRDYFRIIGKRLWIVVLVTVLAAGSTYGFSKIMTPEYRSTIYLNVVPARPDWGLQQTILGYLRNYAGEITSRTNALETVNRLQLDITPDQLIEKLTVSPIESDLLIQIDADDYDPIIAANIAQTSAEVFVENINARMLEVDKSDRVDVYIRDYAPAGHLHKPKPKINALAGAVFGLLAGLVVVLVLEWLEADVIRTSTDLERHTDLPVLGTIPAAGASRSGSKRSLPWRQTKSATTSD